MGGCNSATGNAYSSIRVNKGKHDVGVQVVYRKSVKPKQVKQKNLIEDPKVKEEPNGLNKYKISRPFMRKPPTQLIFERPKDSLKALRPNQRCHTAVLFSIGEESLDNGQVPDNDTSSQEKLSNSLSSHFNKDISAINELYSDPLKKRLRTPPSYKLVSFFDSKLVFCGTSSPANQLEDYGRQKSVNLANHRALGERGLNYSIQRNSSSAASSPKQLSTTGRDKSRHHLQKQIEDNLKTRDRRFPIVIKKVTRKDSGLRQGLKEICSDKGSASKPRAVLFINDKFVAAKY